MLTASQRQRASGIVAALFLAYLSIAAALATPHALQRNTTPSRNSPPVSKLDGSSAISAAISSIQTGHGPASLGQVSCSSTEPGNAYCQVAQNPPAISIPATSPTSGTATWTNITVSSGPPARDEASMAYDTADGYVLLFGGEENYRLVGDTWKFLGGSWTNITSNSGPSPRIGASIVYDTADGYVLLFGGYGRSGPLGDTWKFLTGSWTNITVSTGPSPRSLASTAYDTADGYIILFGGGIGFGSLRDTWRFLGGSWTNITSSTGPSPRWVASMAYDTADGYVVLFGGTDALGALGDTWKFLGGSWTNITPSISPAPRGHATMVYDAADGYVVLFGGSSTGFIVDTWKFLAGSWTNIALSTEPPARGNASMVYDAADGYVVLFAGFGSSGVDLGDTWKFSGGGGPPSFDFSLSAPNPNSLTVIQGGVSPAAFITATLSSGTTAPVSFSATGLPNGVTATFTNNPCNPTCIATVIFTATSTATLGTAMVTINVAGGGASHSTQLSLTVQAPAPNFDYTLSVNPISASIPAGSSTIATITVKLTSGTRQMVTLMGMVTPFPSVCLGANSPCGNIALSPGIVTPSATGATSTLTIMSTTIVPPGVYTIKFTGSPSGQSSASATFTLTITAVPSVSTIGCGHNESCAVQSNSTLSNFKLAGNTLHVEADGPKGAIGYANVTIPKSEIPHIETLHVFIDNKKLDSSAVTITSNSTDYFIYFTFTFHSPVLIDIQLTTPENAPNLILGIDPTLFSEITGGLAAAIIIVSAALLVRRRGRTRPTV